MTQIEKNLELIESHIILTKIRILELETDIVNMNQRIIDIDNNKLYGKCFKPFANSTHCYQINKVVSIHGTDLYCEVLSVSPSHTLVKHTYHSEDAFEITYKEFNTRLTKYESDLIQRCKRVDTSWYKKLIDFLNK